MRSRNIKPGFFENEDIAELDFIERLFFIGLWCYSDREGLFEIREKRLRAVIFPYDNCDIATMLASLERVGLITIYEVCGARYGQVKNFKKHQKPHPHETKSKLPQPMSLHGSPMSLHGDNMDDTCSADIMNTQQPPNQEEKITHVPEIPSNTSKTPQCGTDYGPIYTDDDCPFGKDEEEGVH